MTCIPGFVRGDEVDVDRLLIAGWFMHDGEVEMAEAVARSVVGRRVAGTMVGAVLRQIAEHFADYRACEDDPRTYARLHEGIDTGAWYAEWRGWGEAQCEQILADAVVDAEALLTHAHAAAVA